MVCATVFPSNTVISMSLPDSASIFTAEIWEIIKALEERKTSCCIQIHCFYRLTFVSPSFTMYETGTSLDWCAFFYFVGYLAILVLEVMKRHTPLPRLH